MPEEQALAILEAFAAKEALDSADGRICDLNRFAQHRLSFVVPYDHLLSTLLLDEAFIDGDRGGTKNHDEEGREYAEDQGEDHLHRRLVGLLLRPLPAPDAHLVCLDTKNSRNACTHGLGLHDSVDKDDQVGNA